MLHRSIYRYQCLFVLLMRLRTTAAGCTPAALAGTAMLVVLVTQGRGTGSGNGSGRPRSAGRRGNGVAVSGCMLSLAATFLVDFTKKIAEIKAESSRGSSSGNEVLPAGGTAWENAGRHLQIYQAGRRAGTAGSWGASEDLAGRDHLAVNSLGRAP